MKNVRLFLFAALLIALLATSVSVTAAQGPGSGPSPLPVMPGRPYSSIGPRSPGIEYFGGRPAPDQPGSSGPSPLPVMPGRPYSSIGPRSPGIEYFGGRPAPDQPGPVYVHPAPTASSGRQSDDGWVTITVESDVPIVDGTLDWDAATINPGDVTRMLQGNWQPQH